MALPKALSMVHGLDETKELLMELVTVPSKEQAMAPMMEPMMAPMMEPMMVPVKVP